jgi:hypothetical protein
VDRHAQQLWGTARDLGLDAPTAAAVFRLAWWRLFDHLGELRTDGEIHSWLCSAVDGEARAAAGLRHKNAG